MKELQVPVHTWSIAEWQGQLPSRLITRIGQRSRRMIPRELAPRSNATLLLPEVPGSAIPRVAPGPGCPE